MNIDTDVSKSIEDNFETYFSNITGKKEREEVKLRNEEEMTIDEVKMFDDRIAQKSLLLSSYNSLYVGYNEKGIFSKIEDRVKRSYHLDNNEVLSSYVLCYLSCRENDPDYDINNMLISNLLKTNLLKQALYTNCYLEHMQRNTTKKKGNDYLKININEQIKTLKDFEEYDQPYEIYINCSKLLSKNIKDASNFFLYAQDNLDLIEKEVTKVIDRLATRKIKIYTINEQIELNKIHKKGSNYQKRVNKIEKENINVFRDKLEIYFYLNRYIYLSSFFNCKNKILDKTIHSIKDFIDYSTEVNNSNKIINEQNEKVLDEFISNFKKCNNIDQINQLCESSSRLCENTKNDIFTDFSRNIACYENYALDLMIYKHEEKSLFYCCYLLNEFLEYLNIHIKKSKDKVLIDELLSIIAELEKINNPLIRYITLFTILVNLTIDRQLEKTAEKTTFNDFDIFQMIKNKLQDISSELISQYTNLKNDFNNCIEECMDNFDKNEVYKILQNGVTSNYCFGRSTIEDDKTIFGNYDLFKLANNKELVTFLSNHIKKK